MGLKHAESNSNSEQDTPADKLTFSVIIPVLNEQQNINSVIEHVKNQAASSQCEIIVVDGDSDGSTIKAIQADSATSVTAQKGRAWQLNAGAEIAKGQILLFLHADTKLPPNAFDKISEVMANPKYVAGAFDIGVDSDRFSIKLIAARSRIRSHVTRVPYGDQAIFIRKKYFDKIGRFKEIPLLEDVDLMVRIRKKGDKIRILRNQVSTSARRWEREGVLYTTLRNLVVVTLYRFGVSPEKLAKYYKAHSK